MAERKRSGTLAAATLLTGVLAGTTPALESSRFSAPIAQRRAVRARPTPRNPPKTSVLAPGDVRFLGEARERYVGDPISLDLKDADLKDVLLTFAKLSKTNMVIDPDVKGSVTVRLENVPWDQALELILKVNGLSYVVEGNIVLVGTPSRF